MSKNISWQPYSLQPDDYSIRNGHKAAVLWFTGLSGSGKSTLANAVSSYLFKLNKQVFSLDGDNIRHGINADLSFSNSDRTENIRRVTEIAKLFTQAGFIITTAFISPFKKDRDFARNAIGKNFIEIFVDTPLSVCQKRDPKKLYEKQKAGEIQSFTGIDSTYENPLHPEIRIETDKISVEDSVRIIIDYLGREGIL